MIGCRRRILAVLIWAQASLATTVSAHALIDALDAHQPGEDAYGTYAHVGFAPLVILALTLLAALFSVAVVRRIGAREAADPVSALLRAYAALPFGRTFSAVAAGGFAALMALEFAEQTHSLGHIAGITTALGGCAPEGAAVVTGIAAVVVALGLSAVRVVVASMAAAVAGFVARIIGESGLRRSRIHVRRTSIRFGLAPAVLTARCRGLRAPPAAV